MAKFYLKTIRYFLALIGIFLGFSSKVMAQYGVWVHHFKVNININSSVCDEPVSNVLVKIEDNASGRIFENHTDEAGQISYSHRSHFYGGDNKLNISIKDSNGNYESANKTFYLTGFVDTLFNITLDHKDIPPCLQEETAKPLNETFESDTLLEGKILLEIEEENILSVNPIESTPNIYDLVIFPNPNNGIFSLSFDLENESYMIINIYDLQGKLVYNENFYAHSGRINHTLKLPFRAAGKYLLQITNENNEGLIKKIIINP